MVSTQVLATEFEEKKVYKNFRFENDMESTGVACSQTFSFNIEKDWKVSDGYLNLVFTQSELLYEEQSTMTILINNIPVHSMTLSNKKKYKEELKIPFHLDNFKKGYNEVKIKTHRRISDMICQDELNSANWIVFHKESYVHVDFYDKKDTNQLREFPYPYITKRDSKDKINFVVSDKADNSEISTIMEVISYFGYINKERNLGFNLNKISDNKALNNGNIIYVGKLDNTHENIKKLLNEEQLKKAKDKAIVKEIVSPYNSEYKMLIVISNNEENLKKAGKFITNKSLMKKVKRDYYLVDNTINVIDSLKEEDDKIYFKDLGYGNITLEGPFKQEYNFEINIPQNRLINEDGKICFNIRYSKNLDFENSLLTIYINDEPIGSKKLSEGKGNNDELELTIPKNLRNKNYYNIKARFDLEMEENICDPRGQDIPWAYISNDSYLYATYANRSDFKFENYPCPFVTDRKLNNLGIILSDNPTKYELNLIGNIIGYIGYYVENNSGEVSAIRSSDVNQNFKNKNLIVVGTPQKNSFIKDINKDLHLKYSDDLKKFKCNEKLNFIKEYSDDMVTVQAIKSMYKSGNGIMVVTSPKENNLSLANRYLNNLKLTKSLKGNLVTIDNDKEVNMINYDKNKGSVNNKKIFQMTKKNEFLLIASAISIGLMIVIVVFIKKRYK